MVSVALPNITAAINLVGAGPASSLHMSHPVDIENQSQILLLAENAALYRNPANQQDVQSSDAGTDNPNRTQALFNKYTANT